jgi:hypothetical protein
VRCGCGYKTQGKLGAEYPFRARVEWLGGM